MLNLSRRSLLGAAAPAVLASVFIPPAVAAGSEGSTLIDWAHLSRDTQLMVISDYWGALTFEEKRRACAMMRDRGMADVADAMMPEWSGPGIYEFKLLDRGTRPVAFLDIAAKSGAYVYRWQHCFKGKFQGRGHYVRADRLVIIRKLEGMSA